MCTSRISSVKKGFAPIVILAIVGISIIVGGIVYWQFRYRTPVKSQTIIYNPEPIPNYSSSPSPKTAINPSPTSKSISDEIVAKFEDSGKTISLKQGAKVKVVLYSTYWNFDKIQDDNILNQLSNPIYVSDNSAGPPGSGAGTVTVEYQAISKGQSSIAATRTLCGETLRCIGDKGSFMLNIIVN